MFGQYHFDSWTTDNGLPQNGVRAITQTPDGYLWFTTFDGLVRFDGVKFTTFSKGNTKGIINNRFITVHSDKDGTVYASTAEDGVLTVYQNGVFTSYDAQQVPELYIREIKTDEKGEVVFWVETGNAAADTWYYLRNGKFVFKEERRKKDFGEVKSPAGTIWKITKNKVFEKRDGKTIVYPYKVMNFNPEMPVYPDRNGALWLGGNNLIYFKNGKVEYFKGKKGLPNDSEFNSFWEESDGSLWFSNGGRSDPGAGFIRYKDSEFEIFGKEAGLTSTNVQTVFRDRENNVWIGTGKGLNRLRKSVITAKSVKDGLSNQEVYPIYRDSKNTIWVGTQNGLNIYKDGKFELVKFGENYWKNRQMTFQSLFEDSNGKMWLGFTGGILILENGQVELLKGIEDYVAYSILQDRKGKVWAATNKGILVFEDYKLVKNYTEKDGLPNNLSSVVYEDSKGGLWFGGYGGLSKFEDGKFINYTTKDGLTGNYVRTIYEDKTGTFWIGTYDEGLSRFKNRKFVNFKKENGLYSNGVFAIEEDGRGYFWMTSNQGIYRVKKQSLENFADGKIEKIVSVGYDKSDGMLNIECNGGRQPASMRNENGHFWFPTQDGVVIVDPEAETYNSLPPPVVIESAAVEREKVDIQNGLTIEPGQKNIEINFTAISLIKSDQIKFKYKLVGHDSDWIDADTDRTAYYSYLPPGKYQFLVKAANSDGIWNEQGASLNLKLEPFFYQTNWFYMLCAALFVFVLLIGWKIAVFRLASRERHLAKLVGEKTAELEIANSELKQLANSDGLTKIGNRRRFNDFLADEWHRAIRFKTEISLILIDIDHFKLFNDTYGHQNGDDCLQKVAEALAATINRPTDLAARFGGEEFAIILGGTDEAGALIIAKQAMENVKNLQIPHSRSKTSEYLTISIGVATTFAKLGMTEAVLIKSADQALYQAKENGRNRFVSGSFPQVPYQTPIAETDYAEIA